MYNQIKQLAKDHSLKVDELIALSTNNDPFYVGRPAQVAAAEWFTDLWHQFGYSNGVHLRRVHYRIVSQNPPLTRPDGTVYQNTDNDWRYLCNAGKYARYLGLVDASSFVDRRNPEAVINARYYQPGDYDYRDPAPGSEVTGGWYTKTDDYDWQTDDSERYALPELPELPELPYSLPDEPYLSAQGYIGTPQPFLIEIWAEKTTMNDVLEPLCEQYNVNLVTGAGEMSITSVVDLLNRVKAAGHPARILYISDYDPAGLGMPISVARKIEFYLDALENEGHDIKLQPIVLTASQVAEYSLPRVPVKDSDRRKANWEATQGQGAVELDALEALYPGELAEIVEAEILTYYDPDLPIRLRSAQEVLQSLLYEASYTVIENYQEDIEGLGEEYEKLQAEWSATQEKFNRLVADFEPDIEAHRATLEDITERINDIHRAIRDDLSEVEIEYPEIPEPDLPQESDSLLYASDRDYFEQLTTYKNYRNGGNGHQGVSNV